ncbi:hypothetical protein CU098_008114, partial [Rhizopus stolonifer]
FTERAFPYTNLTSVDDLLKCPGFIAGVTNPTYEEHTSWWDVLCNISTGKITVSHHIESNHVIATPTRKQSVSEETSLGVEQAQSPPFHQQQFPAEEKRDSDVEFMNEVMTAIQSHYGETSIRAKFQDYVLRFVRLAALYEEQVYGHTNIGRHSNGVILGCGPVFVDEASKQRELKANANRIEGWRQSISYRYYERDINHWLQNACIKNLDVYRQISKLKKLKHIPDQEVAAIYEAFLNNIVTHRQMIEVSLTLFV